MKYPPLEEPCKSCIGKCFRCEDINFIKDEDCIHKRKPREEIKEILGIQERIWK